MHNEIDIHALAAEIESAPLAPEMKIFANANLAIAQELQKLRQATEVANSLRSGPIVRIGLPSPSYKEGSIGYYQHPADLIDTHPEGAKLKDLPIGQIVEFSQPRQPSAAFFLKSKPGGEDGDFYFFIRVPQENLG